MIFIFCLGNVGVKYEKTPHNLGFLFADYLHPLALKSFTIPKQECFSFKNKNEIEIFICKPTTYLNNSGDAVRKMLEVSKLKLEEFLKRMVVVYDDAEVPMHEIRVKEGTGTGGHNGLRSIYSVFKQGSIMTKIALGCDGKARRDSVLHEYVLKKMPFEDFTNWQELLETWAVDFVDSLYVDSGILHIPLRRGGLHVKIKGPGK